MKQYNENELGLTRTPKLEQAMAWLVDNGPVHQNPALPAWMLHDLVAAERIANVRRGVYVVPTPAGQLWRLPAVATRLDPAGYLSFYGALTLRGLTDQDTALWGFVTKTRQAPLRFGQFRLDFVPWPKRLRNAETKMLDIGRKELVRIATPTQALCDTLEAPRYAPNWSELLHVLRTGIARRKLSVAGLRARAIAINSPALARRLGLLLELETGQLDSVLLAIARRSNNTTRLAGLGGRIHVIDPTWRIELPRTREDLLRAVRD